MRVLHTISTIDPATGGPARSVPALVRALVNQGVAAELWTAGPVLPEWLKNASLEEVPVHHGPFPRFADFNLVHDHGLWLRSNHAVARAATGAALPRVVSPRGMLEPWALNHRKWKKRLAWCLYQKADLRGSHALHATAESEATQFRKLGLRNRIHVIPNGVDLPLAAPEGRKVESLKSEGGHQRTDDGRRTALFLSRIHPKKGLPLLVEAWAKVMPAGWRMRVVGPDEGGHRAELESLVLKAGLKGCWDFCDALEGAAKDAAFQDAELFVLPTYSENFGIAVAEALAAGLPVITTTGAPWKGLLETQSGWWVDPTVPALATALHDACTGDAPALQAMGDRGREWMRRDFSWEGVATKMIRSYDKILREQP